MDQIKIGNFIRELRREHGLTQEQFGEQFRVSRRTVSRWETGSNLPDLDVLIEMADAYRLDLRELLDGERRSDGGERDRAVEETVQKVADYSSGEKQRLMERMHKLFIVGTAAFLIYLGLLFADAADTFTDGFVGGVCLGITLGMMLVGVIMTSRYALQIRAFKQGLLRKLLGRGAE